MKKRVFVSGPISKGDLRANIARAREAGAALMRAGFAPFVPHLTCYMGGDTPEALPLGTRAEDWYGVDLPWVAASDAVLLLPGESVGADLEVVTALLHGVPVFITLEDLIAWFDSSDDSGATGVGIGGAPQEATASSAAAAAS